MFIENNIISFITARGGSKGIPRKNIKLLNNKPLINYTIEASLNSKFISETYVTTEDEEIANISRNCGAKIIERPIELAQDDTNTVDVILHALDYLEDKNNVPKYFVLLQPTSPLRNNFDIDKSIKFFEENDANALVSVCEQDHANMLNLKINNGLIEYDCTQDYLKTPRQKLNKLYYPNGAIYIIKPDVFRKYKTFFPKNTIPFLMDKKKRLDIDDLFDFELAEYILNKENDIQ